MNKKIIQTIKKAIKNDKTLAEKKKTLIDETNKAIRKSK
jgi:hypothetical protein